MLLRQGGIAVSLTRCRLFLFYRTESGDPRDNGVARHRCHWWPLAIFARHFPWASLEVDLQCVTSATAAYRGITS
jgi:hypothetical protein